MLKIQSFEHLFVIKKSKKQEHFLLLIVFMLMKIEKHVATSLISFFDTFLGKIALTLDMFCHGMKNKHFLQMYSILHVFVLKNIYGIIVIR